MITLVKYGALSGGEKYNVNQMYIDGLSTDAKPTTTIDGMGIPNGSVFTEVDTGTTYMYDSANATWYEVSIGGGGGRTQGGIVLVGETTTALTDGATTNPITVDGQSYTAQPNDAVLYDTKEFLFDGTKWHEFGDMTGLGTAAFEDVPTSGDASTTQVVMGNDSRLGKMARIIMDSTETQDYYMQDSTPSNPQEGDYWFTDEPIVSADVSAMTGYTKAQSASAIAATDTLNEAIGKVEKKADDNQNNILLLEHANGQKNILRYNAADVANTTEGGRVVPTVNSDRSISLSGTAGSSAEIIRIARVNNDTAIKTGNYLYGNTVSGIRLIIQTAGTPYTIYATGTESGALIQDISDNITVDLKLYIEANKNCDGIIIYPMIQTADMHSAGFTDYQPYAMSNAELTQTIGDINSVLEEVL